MFRRGKKKGCQEGVIKDNDVGSDCNSFNQILLFSS